MEKRDEKENFEKERTLWQIIAKGILWECKRIHKESLRQNKK